jgi:hypothetical protein
VDAPINLCCTYSITRRQWHLKRKYKRIARFSWYHLILTDETWQKGQFKRLRVTLLQFLAGVDESFPTNLWDRLVPQAVMTLNLLNQLNKNPSISAYQHVNGNFDYNKMPLGPLGCAVEIHESPNRCKTWDPRTISGWYLGTSKEHYRCHKIFCKRTRSERILDTVWFKHRYITQPTITSDDIVVKAIGDIFAQLEQ